MALDARNDDAPRKSGAVREVGFFVIIIGFLADRSGYFLLSLGIERHGKFGICTIEDETKELPPLCK